MTKPKKGSHHLRQGRYSRPGQIYLLTTATHNRRHLFTDARAAKLVMDSLHWLEKQGRITLEAMVIMPDHLHFVAQLHNTSLDHLMRSLKGYTGKELNRLLGSIGPAWQAQYHDHAVRKDEALRQVILYCLENPVRAGLVEDFHCYAHWYCRYDI